MQDKQTNLILTIVSIVLALGASAALFFTKREPIAPPPAPQAVLTPPAVAAAEVQYGTSLTGAGAAGGAPAFGGPPRGFGGPPGMGGPPGGMMGRPGAGGPPMGAASAPGAGGRPGAGKGDDM